MRLSVVAVSHHSELGTAAASPPGFIRSSVHVTDMLNSLIGAKVTAIVLAVIIIEYPEHIIVSPPAVVSISPGTTP